MRHAPGVLTRTFAKGTTLYLWAGVDQAVEAKRLETVDDDSRRVALGLPSESFDDESATGCRVLDRAPSGRFQPNLDYPESERHAGVGGVVMLLVRVAPGGSVSGIYPARTTPGRPAFAESAIRAACRMRFNEPRFEGQAVVGLYWHHAEFSINADPVRR